MNYDDFDYGYPIEEKKSNDDYIANKERQNISGECRYSRTCYEANCFDCAMYNSI